MQFSSCQICFLWELGIFFISVDNVCQGGQQHFFHTLSRCFQSGIMTQPGKRESIFSIQAGSENHQFQFAGLYQAINNSHLVNMFQKAEEETVKYELFLRYQ